MYPIRPVQNRVEQVLEAVQEDAAEHERVADPLAVGDGGAEEEGRHDERDVLGDADEGI